MWPPPWRTSKNVTDTEIRRGYDLPLTKNKWQFWMVLAMTPLLICFFELGIRVAGMNGWDSWLLRSVDILWFVVVAWEFVYRFGKLHLVTEGIAITVFGRTLRRFPRERIRFLGGVHDSYRGGICQWICVCARSMYELAEEQERRTPKMLRDGRALPGWTESMARKFLLSYANSLNRALGLQRKDLLLLEWSPERLQMLLDMYPGVPWTDLTENKALDAQRNA